MTTVEEWDVKFKSFVDLRNDILCQAKQLQLLVLNLGVIHRVCSIIWETRDKISFEIREKAVSFFVKYHAECLYFVADMVVQYQDGRLIRLHEKNNLQERHRTNRVDYFHLQLNGKDPVPLTLLSLKGFEFERLALKKGFNDFKTNANKSVSTYHYCFLCSSL
jgi:hypothetical protein